MGEEIVKEEDRAPPVAEKKLDDSKAVMVVEKMATHPSPEKEKGPINRDVALAQIETDKKNSLIKAWEDSQKSKAENKAEKKKASIVSWENSKQAHIEAEMKKYEESLEKKKAEHLEKIKNKITMIHKSAEERRAMVEAKRGEALLKAEEEAARYRAIGMVPKKSSWFTS